jgi:hypothetical protein
MSAIVEQIESIRSQTLTQIADLLGTTGPMLVVDATVTPWPPLLAPLVAMVDWCDRKLAEYDPYEVRSRGTT